MLKRLATVGVLTATASGMIMGAVPAMAGDSAPDSGRSRKHQKSPRNNCTNFGENRRLWHSLEAFEFHNFVVGNGHHVGITNNRCKQG
ncbi:hypothetical protein SAMN04489712_101240 [Thermomonospora echinospora]|uniref:Uncharacterized protein n=1 Tax=Thermomonospora echinospora TaxID=1992 RepID=A0A1H5SLG1_9ACTN|nr:hypothetical protein [Thermomonospora echinospora]SEF50798.1 hypothetical protein SAMN04489712_101240 [Thermomonospora echinospora]